MSSETSYQKVTDKIIELIEKGDTLPWQKPWSSVTFSYPRNLFTGREYHGVNVWMLYLGGMVGGYPHSLWLTFNQARELDGCVRKGEKSLPVVWMDILKKKGQEAAKAKEEGKPDSYRIMRYYNVFNVAQCDIPEKRLASLSERRKVDLLEKFAPEQGWPTEGAELARCQALVDGYPSAPKINHVRQNKAFYNPSADEITMPTKSQFEGKVVDYFAILFHEMTHSTGHPTRLDRETLKDAVAFGTENYSKEELVAEMGAALLCAIAGVENNVINRSASYLKSWLSKLKGDTKLIVSASAQAQRAVDHILNRAVENGAQKEAA